MECRSSNLARRNPRHDGSLAHVMNNDCISTDNGAVSNAHRPQDFGAATDIDMGADYRDAISSSRANSHAGEDQTIRSDFGVWMDHYTVGVRNQQPDSQSGVERNICRSDDAPEPVPEYGQLGEGYSIPLPAPVLVGADAGKK